jgi:hypothetical protein
LARILVEKDPLYPPPKGRSDLCNTVVGIIERDSPVQGCYNFRKYYASNLYELQKV